MRGNGLERWDGRSVCELRTAWSIPYLEAHETVGSTSDRAKELAEAGAQPWSTVVADEQSQGRGRRGAVWISPAGAGLWMSVLLEADAVSGAAPLEVGLACAEAIESLVDGAVVGIKWPNDLVVEGAKVGGVLCEVAGNAVVAGIGVNVSDAPAPGALAGSGGLPPGSLRGTLQCSAPRHALAGEVLSKLKARLNGGAGTTGRVSSRREAVLAAATLQELRRRDVLAGRLVETEAAGVGRADGIDASGALRLVREDGSTTPVASGSVRLSSGGVGDS